MTKIINLQKNNDSVDVGRDDTFHVAAKKLSDEIGALPIDGDTNNRLILLMMEQVSIAEKSAFYRGVELGLRISAHINKPD